MQLKTRRGKLIFIILGLIIVISVVKNYRFVYSTKKVVNNKRIFEYKKCYEPSDNLDIKIIHLIITRFMLDKSGNITAYNIEYILNGIRVLKKYLLPSLENQSCKNFIWILLVGNRVNISYINSILSLKTTFEYQIINQKEIKKYIKYITKSFNILITTRIDYDDRIYYDAVNDVRKQVNIDKPMSLYGYNRGVYYFESDGKYYDYYRKNAINGVSSIFASLILVLNKVTAIYTIYDIGDHTSIRKNLINKYKLYGIKEINYEPTTFDSGDIKFVFVRQKYSGTLPHSIKLQNSLKEKKLSLSKFYGKSYKT